MKRPVEHMNLGMAKRLLSEIKALELAPKVTFHVMGEPTLHPHFLDILRFSARLGLENSLVTNGMKLGGEEGKHVSQLPLDEITVSIQTPDPDSFAYRHAPLGFEAYRQQILTFVKTAHHTHPQTHFYLRFLNTMLFGKSHMRKPQLGPACSSFPELRSALLAWGHALFDILPTPPGDKKRVLDRLARLSLHRWNRLELWDRLQFDIWPLIDWQDWSMVPGIEAVSVGDCLHHKDHLAILSNGEIVLCCMDFNGRTSLGNVHNCLLTDVLQGTKAQYVLGEFAHGRIALPFCRRCLGSWQQALSGLRRGKSMLSTQRAIETTLQSACQLWT